MREVIQSFWRGRPLSKLEILSLKSFLQNGHEFVLWSYDHVANIPAGVTRADAREILPESAFFLNTSDDFGKGSPSPFSDLFRMALLALRGGWWVDLDVVCLRPWDIPAELVIASSDEREYGILPNANALRSPAGHSFVVACAARLRARDASSAGHADGPHTVQQFVKDLHLEDAVAPPYWFNPVQWRYVKYLLQPEEFYLHPRRLKRTFGITERVGKVHHDSYAVHLWGEMWTQSGLDRDARYHPDSILERLKHRYGVD
jgi:hypothetical protein